MLAALVRRFHEAKAADRADAAVTLWGSGTPRREFLYADDLADAVAFVLGLSQGRLRAAAPDRLLNVGVGEDLPISELATLVRDVVGSESEVRWDASKPDGTPRKLLDVSRMAGFGWRATTPLRADVDRTYRWYLAA